MYNTNSSNVRNGKLPLRTFLVFVIILLFAVSITWWLTRNHYDNRKATDSAFLRLDSSLNNVNKFLIINNETLADGMAEKLKDPGTVEKALLWKSKSDSAFLLANQFYNFIEESRLHLKEDQNNIYQTSFIKSVYDSLSAFTYNLQQLIPPQKKLQLSLLPVEKLLGFDPQNDKFNWTSTYSKNLSSSARFAMLSKIELDVLSSSNMIMDFMASQSSGSTICCVTHYIPQTIQNTTCLLPGQTLEITAGLGSYDVSINPTVSIDNKKISCTDGYGIYKKIITSGKGGSIPVTITFRNPNTGETQTVSKNITYTVMQPK